MSMIINEEVSENNDYSVLTARKSDLDYSPDKEAKQWSEDNLLYIVYDPVIDYIDKDKRYHEDLMNGDIAILDVLERIWDQFQSQPVAQQYQSDDEAVRIYGYTNYQYYSYLKNKYMRNDDIHIHHEMVEEPLDTNSIEFSGENVDFALNWSKETGLIIVVPCSNLDDLEALWHNFNCMNPDHRRESDMLSIHLFGAKNRDCYRYLRSIISRTDDIEEVELEDIDEAVSMKRLTSKNFGRSYIHRYGKTISSYDLMECVYKIRGSITSSTERKLFDDLVDNVADERKEGSYVTSEFIPYGDMPFFTPEEMIDFGVFNPVDADNYFGVQADNHVLEDGFSSEKWFENYQYNFSGTPTVEGATMAPKWLNAMRRLYSDFDQIKESKDSKRILARMQSILELGWNPYIKFSVDNRVNANYRTETKIQQNSNIYEFVDARCTEEVLDQIQEATKRNKELKPVFVLFIGGHTLFSNIVKGVTKSNYSHAAISLDTTMQNIYSFGMSDLERLKGKTSLLGGLTHEKMDKYTKGTPVSIFGFFVKEKDYDQIKKNLDWFIDHAKETTYSYENLLAYLFRIPMIKNTRLICSQFVDRILKLSDVDLTGESSAFIAPADLEKRVKQNSKIYHFFEDINTNFKEKNLNKLVNRIGRTAKPIKEAVLYNALNPKLLEMVDRIFDPSIVLEARPTPLEFDDDGNLIIHGDIMNVDYEAEYSKSHKILMAAEESKSYETMKYELAKLWMMNIILEKKLHQKNVKETDRRDWNNARARILNDFTKYIEIVLKHEPNFNFSRYYEESPFNASAIKISKNTVRYTADTLKRLFTYKANKVLPFVWID